MKPVLTKILCAIGLIMGLVLAGCASSPTVSTETISTNNVSVNPAITVFRSPTCGCCGKWIEHMEAAGFTVEDNVTQDMDVVKRRYGVPGELESCHTAIAQNYVIEGHVPAEDVRRLLMEGGAIAGLAAPGMPMGSPGMEVESGAEPYAVMAFTADGASTVFANHP